GPVRHEQPAIGPPHHAAIDGGRICTRPAQDSHGVRGERDRLRGAVGQDGLRASRDAQGAGRAPGVPYAGRHEAVGPVQELL
ncbi:hypothetical protein ABTD92_20510, partial [Acinetobacter baumannii]